MTSATWDDLSAAATDPGLSSDLESNYREPYSQTPPTVFEHPCSPLTKILSSGTFYYAIESNWDLSSRLAVRLARDSKRSPETLTFDERFVWNEYIIRSLIDFRERLDPYERDEMDRCQFIVREISFFQVSLRVLTGFSTDIGNTRLCRSIHNAASCTTHRRSSDGCNSRIDIQARVEKSRDQIQHPGRGRRRKYG